MQPPYHAASQPCPVRYHDVSPMFTILQSDVLPPISARSRVDVSPNAPEFSCAARISTGRCDWSQGLPHLMFLPHIHRNRHHNYDINSLPLHRIKSSSSSATGAFLDSYIDRAADASPDTIVPEYLAISYPANPPSCPPLESPTALSNPGFHVSVRPFCAFKHAVIRRGYSEALSRSPETIPILPPHELQSLALPSRR